MNKAAMKKILVLVVLLLLLAGVMVMSTAQIFANELDPFLWPYNQPTNISFNENVMQKLPPIMQGETAVCG